MRSRTISADPWAKYIEHQDGYISGNSLPQLCTMPRLILAAMPGSEINTLTFFDRQWLQARATGKSSCFETRFGRADLDEPSVFQSLPLPRVKHCMIGDVAESRPWNVMLGFYILPSFEGLRF